MLGLEAGKVLLVEYDPEWPSDYQLEAEGIKNVLGNLIIDIQHIGSTSIVGLKAKPIIDILVGLQSFDAINEVIRKMKAAGYIYADNAKIPNDHTFRRGESLATHLIHVVEYGKVNWWHNITFRDALRNDPALKQEYEQLKIQLAGNYSDYREKYTAGKGNFIFDVVKTHRKTRPQSECPFG